MKKCFNWFLGANDLNMPLYDFKTHGCHDGLHDHGISRHQGAESTLSWLLSALRMHQEGGFLVSGERSVVSNIPSRFPTLAAYGSRLTIHCPLPGR
jgi:hypothetical protein